MISFSLCSLRHLFITAMVSSVIIVIGIQTALGQARDLITDRPDQTESSETLDPGYYQLELGWTHRENKDGGTKSEGDSYPETLLRMGILPDLELRLGFSGYQSEKIDDRSGVNNKETGMGDTEIGFKYDLGDERGLIPDTAFLFHLSIPSGDDEFTTNRHDPSFRFLFSHTLSDRFSFSYNLGTQWETNEDLHGDNNTLAIFQYTTSLGLTLTERLGGFIELFGDIPLNAHGNPANSFNGGFTFQIKKNIQFDIAGGVGLSDYADDWFAGVGLSVRLPD